MSPSTTSTPASTSPGPPADDGARAGGGEAVTATLRFIRPQADKPVFHSAALAGDVERFFFEVDAHAVAIRSMRDRTPRPSLDHEGFALVTRPSAVADFYDDDAIERVYHAEVRDLVAAALGADEVVVFDVTRRSDAPAGANNADGARRPASRAHVDYTVDSGPKRAADILGQQRVSDVLARGGRIVQINVWRPIRGPVRRSPLALADASTVTADALVATDQVFPDRVGEIYHLAYDPRQRWFYAPAMTPDEAILIKSFDSATDGRARFTPHAAFSLPDGPEGAPPRESIEVRTFAVIEPAR